MTPNGTSTGFDGAFEDPWGNMVIMWTKGGDDPQTPEDDTCD